MEQRKSDALQEVVAAVKDTAAKESEAKQAVSLTKSKMDGMQAEHDARTAEKDERVKLSGETFANLKVANIRSHDPQRMKLVPQHSNLAEE